MEKPTDQDLLQKALDSIHQIKDPTMLINIQNAVENQIKKYKPEDPGPQLPFPNPDTVST